MGWKFNLVAQTYFFRQTNIQIMRWDGEERKEGQCLFQTNQI